MKITFLTNLVNHHQIYVADELFKHYGHDYTYVAFERLPEWLRKGGYQELERSFILKAYESAQNKEIAEKLALESDIVIIGSAPEYLVKRRLKENKITFHYSERWFKDISYKLFSPRLWAHILSNHVKYRNKRSYMLCASAFTARDVNRVFAYPHKCFKWGYFTKVDNLDIESILAAKRGETRIMWCARFLKWKHPELVVKLAKKLKASGYKFEIDMFGSGEESENIKSMAKAYDVTDVLSFKGNLPNDEILQQMRQHNIFLFTSDRHEGWGAVLNESMSNGCAVVASDKIGSVPFLIKHQVNGLIYKSGNMESLFSNVKFLLDNPNQVEIYAKEAYQTMQNEWSPKNAALNLMTLLEIIQNGNLKEYKKLDGPCSWA